MSLESELVALNLDAFWRAGADEVSLTSGKIDTAYDLTGNGYDVTQPTDGMRPTRNASWLNGAPSMVCAGGQVLNHAANVMTAATNWTMGIVWSTNSTSTPQIPFRPCALGGAGPSVDVMAGQKREVFSQGAGIPENGAATTLPEVWILSRDTTDVHLYVGLLGAEVTLSAPGVTVSSPTGALISVGAFDNTGLLGLDGNLGEAWFVQRLLTGSERASYLGYVSQKYWTFSASVTSVLGALASASAATEALPATMASALGAFGGSGTAAERLAGAVTSTIPLASAALGTETIAAGCLSTMGGLVGDGLAVLRQGAAGASSLAPLAGVGTGAEHLPASILSLLGKLAGQGTAHHTLPVLAAPRLRATLIAPTRQRVQLIQPTRLRVLLVGSKP